tara:strand:+ start:894 stop:998 length:105 start_codon:yes stop_codon:yes gene_type:complete
MIIKVFELIADRSGIDVTQIVESICDGSISVFIG